MPVCGVSCVPFLLALVFWGEGNILSCGFGDTSINTLLSGAPALRVLACMRGVLSRGGRQGNGAHTRMAGMGCGWRMLVSGMVGFGKMRIKFAFAIGLFVSLP